MKDRLYYCEGKCVIVAVDTSPYAQTGVSVWELRGLRLGDRTVLAVVHDIERMNPNILDFYAL